MNQKLKFISYYAQTKKNATLIGCYGVGWFFFALPTILHKAEYAYLWRPLDLKKLRTRYVVICGTYPKFSEKLTFFTHWYLHERVRIRVQQMLVFRKILHAY